MISIRTTTYGLDVALFNEFTLEDFKAFETAILEFVTQGGRPSLLIDLTQLQDFTIDMAIEELRFMREHDHEVNKIAVAVTDTWLSLAAHLAGWFVDNPARYFSDVDQARAWLLKS